MSTVTPIQLLLVEDEDFDVARVRNTVALLAARIHIAGIASNGKAALISSGQSRTSTMSSSWISKFRVGCAAKP